MEGVSNPRGHFVFLGSQTLASLVREQLNFEHVLDDLWALLKSAPRQGIIHQQAIIPAVHVIKCVSIRVLNL